MWSPPEPSKQVPDIKESKYSIEAFVVKSVIRTRALGDKEQLYILLILE